MGTKASARLRRFGRTATISVWAFVVGIFMTGPAGAFDADSIEKQITDQIGIAVLELVPKYRESTRDRALAACIDWDASSKGQIDVRNLYWFYTDPGSDVPVFHSKLMNLAIAECDRTRPPGENCRCARVATNDTIVLEAPAAVLDRFVAQGQ